MRHHLRIDVVLEDFRFDLDALGVLKVKQKVLVLHLQLPHQALMF